MGRGDGAGAPPIESYAIIGDCRTAALVGRDGSIDWFCVPHFSGPAVFAALLDQERGGRFSIRPRGPFRSRRRYLPETAVLETTFETDTGTLVLTDAMSVLNEDPEALDPESEILRTLEATDGSVEVDVLYAPRPDYARRRATIQSCMDLGWSLQDGPRMLFLRGDLDLEEAEDGAALIGRHQLEAGQRRHISLSMVENDIGIVLPLGGGADERQRRTCEWWRSWSAGCRYDGPHRDMVVRSAITLKLLTFSLSGAVVAAATASLPETIGGARNWDYRYCWLRDASLTLEAFLELGNVAEAAAFMEWLLHSTRLTWPELQVLYHVYGEANVPEEDLPHLSGYADSRPVRIGNAAWDQLQLDAYGQVVVAAASYAMRGGTLDIGEQRMLRGLGNAVCKLWRRPDAGLWEVRGDPRHYTHSKLMCWAALDCLLWLDSEGKLSVPREKFARQRAAIQDMLETQCLDQELGYRAAADKSWSDASLLLMARYRYLSGDDPRMVKTLNTIDADLGVGDGLLLRYRPGFDGMEGEQHPFGICSFWAVEALARQGRLDEAVDRFDRLCGFANDVGLFAEEIEAGTGQAIGNFPQAFTHVGLIHAALEIAAASDGGGRP
jgi:GH15 family glucan-1,4-alpha-glucosidase